MAIAAADDDDEMRHARSKGSGRKPPEQESGASNATARPQPSPPEMEVRLMEKIVSRANMMAAYQRVMANKGAAGIDRMTVEQLQPYLKEHWPRIKEELLEGRYRPQPVRGVEIPKPGGGMRQLGIPTVVDRLIQQAMHQVLMPLFDPGFSKASYGLRPGRSAHDAVLAARAHVAEGRRFVVDLEPRCADGTGGAPGCGQTGAADDPPLPEGWIDDGRDYDGAERRHAARRPSYSPYAKGNFTFDRVICGWRGLAVLDLRLKR
jgi:RNA-directed DNA polymerase